MGVSREQVKEEIAKALDSICHEPCKTCDCLQGYFTQLEMDADEDVSDLTEPYKVQREFLHGCLGCDPCGPGAAYADYLKRQSENTIGESTMQNVVIEKREAFERLTHKVDTCVVGGGLAGLCAALASARRGARTLLMQDRPVLGGNASSEVRMWICGAHGQHNKETGLLEELMLENYRLNPSLNYSIWDHALYGMAAVEKNLTLLLNTTCLDAAMDGDRIASVEGWQLTSQTRHIVEADIFIDCSGDSILAVPSGAQTRWGRESADEFGEDIEPETADRRTMGNSILLQIRYTETAQPFTAPDWAWRIDNPDELQYRVNGIRTDNFWWMEIGGCSDTIHDAETIRDDLLKLAYGVWDYYKNHAPEKAETENWALEWIGSLPGKRENRRYVGPCIMTQHDIDAGGKFDDIVAYGGWSMDDHHPAGVFYPGKPTIFHKAPSPFGIPFRSLYSVNVRNLMFAGRNISVTHAALSATRVMATCALLGQAVGTAAALCKEQSCMPSEIDVENLQNWLMDDDVWLPGLKRKPTSIASQATLSGNGKHLERLLDGVDRDLPDQEHAWEGEAGDSICFEWNELRQISEVRCVFDSNLQDKKKMPCSYPQDANRKQTPNTLVRDFDIEVRDENHEWSLAQSIRDNAQRLVRVALHQQVKSLRIKILRTWGSEKVRVFACEPVKQQHNSMLEKAERENFGCVREKLIKTNPDDFRDPAKNDA